MINTVEPKKPKIKRKVEYSTLLSSKSQRYQLLASHRADKPLYPSHIRYNLTISEEQKFIWFRVAKVGTRTIMHLLAESGVKLSAEHTNDCYYPVNLYKDYFKFAFVRNPWDRIVSCWFNKVLRKNAFRYNQIQHEKLKSFEYFVDYVGDNIDLDTGNSHFRLQCRLIDLNHLNYLGRLENFEEDLTTVMGILGIQGNIEKRNASKNKMNYREYYSDRVKDKVADLYRRDIQIFNYDF